MKRWEKGKLEVHSMGSEKPGREKDGQGPILKDCHWGEGEGKKKCRKISNHKKTKSKRHRKVEVGNGGTATRRLVRGTFPRPIGVNFTGFKAECTVFVVGETGTEAAILGEGKNGSSSPVQ